jgi:hypothetical protein
MRRQWYIYIVGALLYASAMWLGQFVLFLVGTVIIVIAVVVGEFDRRTEAKAIREAQQRRQ